MIPAPAAAAQFATFASAAYLDVAGSGKPTLARKVGARDADTGYLAPSGTRVRFAPQRLYVAVNGTVTTYEYVKNGIPAVYAVPDKTQE
jgi:hypothetical protein